MTHGDDFVLTGPTDQLSEFTYKMTGVCPIKPTFVSNGSTKGIKAFNRRLYWGKGGQHDPRHVD